MRGCMWMKNEYVTEAMKSGCFTENRLVRLLKLTKKKDLLMHCSLHAGSKADYNRYAAIYLPQIEAKSYARWGNRMLSFGSLMEIVS